MPLYNLPIEEINESITRPVILKVTEDIIERMGLPKNIPVLYKGNSAQHLYNNASLDDPIAGDHNRYENDALITIETIETDNEHQLLNTPVWRYEHRAVFNDPALRLSIFPAMVAKKVDINFNVTGTEKDVERIRASIRRKVSQGVIDLVHMVNYHYPIPLFYMILLMEAFNMRERVAGYGDELGNWLQKNFVKPYGTITNQVGAGTTFVIKENQLPLTGWFDFGTNPPQPEKEQDSGRYNLNFSYSFYYDCPETMSMQCPLVIHNQMLPAKFRKDRRPFEVDFVMQNGSLSQEALNEFRWKYAKDTSKIHRPGLPVPYFDDWLEDKPPRWYTTAVRWLIQVDINDPKAILNLNDLGVWELHPTALHYMTRYHKKLTKPYENLFNLSLYRWDQLMGMDDIEIDENLNIRFNRDLDPRENYHLVLSICGDPTTLTTEGLTDLAKESCFFHHYVAILKPELVELFGWDLEACRLDIENGGDGNVGNGDGSFIDIIKEIDKDTALKHSLDIMIWPLVAGFSIWAHPQT